MQDNDLRISIARGAVFAQHQPRKLEPNGEYLWQDQGEQTFRMLLVPHSGAWQDAGIVRLAEEFTAPLPIIYQGIHRRKPAALGLFSLSGCFERGGLRHEESGRRRRPHHPLL